MNDAGGRRRSPRGRWRAAALAVVATLVAVGAVGAAPDPQGTPDPRRTPGQQPRSMDPPEPTRRSAVLELSDGGFLVGRPLPMRAEPGRQLATLRWQSSLFAEPLEFQLDAVRRIRFASAAAPAVPADAWRVDLADGGVVVGTLESIDPQRVVVTAAGVGSAPLALRRSAIVGMSRTAATVRGILPGGIAGWDVDPTAWQEQGGRLVCRVPNAEAFRTVGAPRRAWFDVVLSWNERPGFELLCAVGPGEAGRVGPADGGAIEGHAVTDEYRLELTAGELLAIREAAAAKFDVAGAVPPGPGRLRIVAFVDQETGRLAVVLPDAADAGRLVFDETVPPRAPRVRPGFAFTLRSGDVRIESLRVGPWTDPGPRMVAAGAWGGPDRRIVSFDAAQAEFTVEQAGGMRQVPAREVTEIVCDGQAEPPTPASRVAVFHGGTRLVGGVLEVAADAIRLDCPGLADPVECGRGQLASLDAAANGPPAAPPHRPAVVDAPAGRMLGWLVPPAGREDGVGWQPRGAVAAVAIEPEGEPLRIAYTGLAAFGFAEAHAAGAAGAGAERIPVGPSVLFLKTGDSIHCTVLSAGPDGARITIGDAPATLVPAVAMRAIELAPGAAGLIPKDKLARLLTLPRMQEADPPTHLVRLPNGDYLRGKLVSLDDRTVRFDVLGTVKELPRAEVSRLIWLSRVGDGSEAKALAVIIGAQDRGGLPVRATLGGGRRVTMQAGRVDGRRLVGTNGALGTVGIDLNECDQIEARPEGSGTESAKLPYAQWTLQPAALPRVLRPKKDAEEPVPPRSSGHPSVGTVARLPVFPLVEPGGEPAGEPGAPAGQPAPEHGTTFTLADCEGQVVVLAVFDPGAAADVASLPAFDEAMAASAAEGVTSVAVGSRAAAADVARAVAMLPRRPRVAADRAAFLEVMLGKAALPAYVVIDREGRVDAVLPGGAAGIPAVQARVEAVVERSRRTADEFRALERAREAARDRDRVCLGQLATLLGAESPMVRGRAAALMRQVTGVAVADMPFDVDGPPARRAAQVRRWRQWLADEGDGVDLVRPPVTGGAAGGALAGCTLVCRSSAHDVITIDAEGNQAFVARGRQPWACDMLPNGHRLVGAYNDKAIVEYDARGREVWAVRGLPGGPMSVRRLDTGNTLVALSDADLVAEYDAAGRQVWTASIKGRPCDARRLPDGCTLVAAHRAKRILEVNAAGEEIWAIDGIDDPQTVQPLPNGNLLLAMSVPGIVREIDRRGGIVWEKQGFKIPVDVQRLPDGTTLVQEQGGDLVSLDPQRNEVGRLLTGGSRFLRW